MSLLIELRREAEEALRVGADAQGISVAAYAGRLLESMLICERAAPVRLEREEFQTMLLRLSASESQNSAKANGRTAGVPRLKHTGSGLA